MSNILALDASAESCSVALAFAGRPTIRRSSSQPRAHAQHLLPFVESLLHEAKVSLADLDAIACAIGPGSFTGLRIALSTAQGLAYASKKPLIGINSLAAMVMNDDLSTRSSLNTHSLPSISPASNTNLVSNINLVPDDCYYIPLLDARMKEVYWGLYLATADELPDHAALLASEENLHANLEVLSGKPLRLLGSAWAEVDFAKSIAASLDKEPILDAEVNAESVLALAQKKLALSGGEKPGNVDLCYCRNSVAWDKRKRIRPS